MSAQKRSPQSERPPYLLQDDWPGEISPFHFRHCECSAPCSDGKFGSGGLCDIHPGRTRRQRLIRLGNGLSEVGRSFLSGFHRQGDGRVNFRLASLGDC